MSRIIVTADQIQPDSFHSGELLNGDDGHQWQIVEIVDGSNNQEEVVLIQVSEDEQVHPDCLVGRVRL